MYKSNHIKYDHYCQFGLFNPRAANLLPDDPSKVIDIFQTLGDIKGRVTKPLKDPTLSQRYAAMRDDVGAVTGVLGTAVGAGINKYATKAGDYLKEWGAGSVLNDNKRARLGNTVLGGAAALGGAGILGGGLLAARKLQENQVPSEYVEYVAPRWRTVDFYH